MKKLLAVTLFATLMLLLSSCYQELGRASVGVADPGDENGWRYAKLGDVGIDFKVKTDWEWKVTNNGDNMYNLVSELEGRGNASFLLVEILSDSGAAKEFAESDMLLAKENAPNEIETVSNGPQTLGDLQGYEWIFNQSLNIDENEPFTCTRYFLFVEKDGYVYRFSFGIAYNLPENFDDLYSEFKMNLALANSDN
jgi:hypothetical protein